MTTSTRIDGDVDASPGDRKFRPDIQGLRAVAVILVVLYHCAVPGMGGGYVGVDVFFVISGFLITRQLISERARAGRISLTGFYARRIKRLLPSALTVIAVTELATRLLGPPLQATPVARDGIFSTFYLMNYRLAAQGVDYQNADGPVSPLQHFWSLAVEEQFYIFWPLTIIGVGMVARRRFPVAMPALAIAATAASFLVSVLVTQQNATLAYYAIQTRGWELGVGAIIAITIPQLLRLPSTVAVGTGWCGLLLIIISAVVFTPSTPFPGSAAAVPVVGAGLVVLSGLVRRSGGPEPILSGRPMQFVGRVSYGWYLWHWPLIVLAPSVLGTRFGWWENLAAALLGLWLATLTNRLIEQVAARSVFGRRRWFVIGAAMSVVVTGVTVAIIIGPPAALDSSGPAAALNLTNVDAAGMSTLLVQGYVSRTVPTNLSPSLASAVDDVPPTSNDGCNVGFLTTAEPPCVFGDSSGRRTVVLFGDSHAEQWFGALNALAKSRGWKLMSWTKAACPLADVLLTSSQLQRPFTECPAWRTATLKKIADLHPDLVIASGSDALPGPGYSNVAWSGHTVEVLGQLKEAAGQVVYLADIPAPTSDVPICLAGNLSDTPNCAFSRRSQSDGLTETNQFPGRHEAVIGAARREGVSVIDPFEWFCSATDCPVIVENTLLYRDATHMTQSYSRALEPVIGRALARLVPWTASG